MPVIDIIILVAIVVSVVVGMVRGEQIPRVFLLADGAEGSVTGGPGSLF